MTHYSLARATVWNISGYIYLLIAALISTPILVLHLGLAQFGLYSLILATLALVSSIDLGLSQSVVRALSRDHEFSEHRRSLWATSSLLFIMTGLVGASIAVFVAYNFHAQLIVLPIIFSLGLINNVVAHYSTLPQAEGHFGYFNIKTYIVGTANTLLAAYLAWNGQGILAILLTLLASYLLTLLVLAYFSLKFFPRPRDGKASLKVAKSLIEFGIKNQVGKLVGQAQSQYGKYLLAALSPITLSAYVISQSLVQKLVGGVVQLATAFYPASSREGINTKMYNIYLKIQLSLLVLGILAVIVYEYIGYQFLIWWLQDVNLVENVHSFLRIFRFYGLLLLLTPLASVVLDSKGRPELTSLYAILTFVIEIILAIILLPYYGLLAPAYAGIVALLLTTPLLLISANKIMLKSTI